MAIYVQFAGCDAKFRAPERPCGYTGIGPLFSVFSVSSLRSSRSRLRSSGRFEACILCSGWHASPALSSWFGHESQRDLAHQAERLVLSTKKTLWTVLLALLCVPASGVGVLLGFLVGCVIAMILQERRQWTRLH
jgi:hypothetical protein